VNEHTRQRWRAGEPLRLPTRIDRDVAHLITTYFAETEHQTKCLDWADVRWINFVDGVVLLQACSKAIATGRVTWSFSLRRADDDASDDQFKAHLEIGEPKFRDMANVIKSLDRQLAVGTLYPRQLDATLKRLRKLAGEYVHVQSWLQHESLRFERARTLGFLRRFDFLNKARDAGIEIDDNVFNLPFVRFAKVHDSSAQPLTSVGAIADVDKLVDDLSNEKYLHDVFADDASSRLIRGGALARILAREFGANVIEHAHARRAWFCSRVTTVGTASRKRRFLEVIVADDGTGLTAKLHNLAAKDPRTAIRRLWHELTDAPAEEQFLLDYAFDRFTSSKRSLTDLMHLPRSERAIVSSGLFWVWNLVASEGGILDVRTANAAVSYDFRRNGLTSYRRRPLPPACAGSLIRVILPITSAPTSRPLARKTDATLDTVEFAYVWAGDLAESEGFPPSDRAPQTSLKIAELAFRESLFARLRQLHGDASDNTILIVDLCGIRPLWEKASVVPLAHFLIESNYTSVFGRSAVVLWNVPETSSMLFDHAVRFAAKQFEHLEQIRRVAVLVFDSGRVQIVANSESVERSLERLSSEGELDLDTMSEHLDTESTRELKRVVRENRHLFATGQDGVVRFRAWPAAITSAVWTRGIDWLSQKLDSSPPSGICFEYPRSVFRLPTLGEYARRFFHFRAVLADREAAPRLAWIMAHAVRAAELANARAADILVSVTRPSSELAHEVALFYSAMFRRRLRVVAVDSAEDLFSYHDKLTAEVAIHITTVISTGSTSSRIARSTPWISSWLGTVACVDTRQGSEALARVQVAPGAWLTVLTESDTGEIYALAKRDVARIRSSDLHGERKISIDPVNVCPVTPPSDDGHASAHHTNDDLWRYARNSSELIRVGHFEESDGHHYVYLVNTSVLLHSTTSDSPSTVLDNIVQRALAHIRDADPNKIIILHPPPHISLGAEIALEFQRRSGAKYKDVLYRDTFAGRSRFNPLGELSLPWKGATVVLLDDATNTGEALMGLLDTAVRSRPRRIVALVALSRLAVHRASLFTGIAALERCADVSIQFALSLDIPVFTPKTCPICQLIRRLSRVRGSAPFLKGVTERLAEQLTARAPVDERVAVLESYVFAARNSSRVARLRESIERSDFDERALQFWERHVADAASHWESVSDVAFILCSEPELVNASAMTSYLLPLLGACEDAVQDAKSDAVVAIVGLAIILSTRLTQIVGGERIAEVTSRISIAILTRADLTSGQLGAVIALLLAYTRFEPTNGPSGRVSASAWSSALDVAADTLSTRLPPISRLYLRALRAATGVDELLDSDEDLGSVAESAALCDRAEDVASTFWSHATENLKNWIDQMELSVPGQAEFSQPLFALAEAMTELQGLRALFVGLDDTAVRRYKVRTGISRTWRTPPVALAIDSLLDPVAAIIDSLDRREHAEIPSAIGFLQQRWSIVRDTLDPAFNELFPEIRAVADRAWQQFEKQAGLPLRIAGTPIWNIDRSERAFVPEPVIWRFLAAAIGNLRTIAFYGLTDDALRRARATLSARKENDEYGRATILVRVSDNGPSFRGGLLDSGAPPGHGEALRAVRVMIAWFAGRLSGPAVDPVTGEAYVELSVRKYK